MKKQTIIVNGKQLHIVLYQNFLDWDTLYGVSECWDFPLEELLDGTIEINENIWYWLINSRCYETNEQV